jgi:hypothetical protein
MAISSQECLKARYGHVVGGTLHSKRVLKSRLLRKQEKSLPHTREEALKILKSNYPELEIEEISFVIRNCHGYYKSKKEFFDPNSLTIIK